MIVYKWRRPVKYIIKLCKHDYHKLKTVFTIAFASFILPTPPSHFMRNVRNTRVKAPKFYFCKFGYRFLIFFYKKIVETT